MEKEGIAEIKTGYGCNNNCIFCLNSQKKVLGDLEGRKVKEKIDEAKALGCETIIFTGGEPSIRNDFPDLCRHVRKLGLKLEVQTNARKFSDKAFAGQVSKIGIEKFVVSIHASNRELHKELTGTDSFEETIQGIKNLAALGNKLVSNTVIVKQNLAQLREIGELMESFGVEKIQFTWPEPMGKALENFEAIVPRFSTAVPFVREAMVGGKASVASMPLCVLGPGFEKFYAVRKNKLDFDLGKKYEPTQKRRLEKKVEKIELCGNCSENELCEGVYKKYLERFGDAELKPIRKRARVTHF